MFDLHTEGPCYYVRLEQGKDYLNLLFVPQNEINDAMSSLFENFADREGYLSYLDPEEYCIVVVRSRDFTGMRVYLYDDVAPYEGVYLSENYFDALDG